MSFGGTDTARKIFKTGSTTDTTIINNSSSHDRFRYFVFDPRLLTDNYEDNGSTLAFNTISILDKSGRFLLINGVGVRGLLRLLKKICIRDRRKQVENKEQLQKLRQENQKKAELQPLTLPPPRTQQQQQQQQTSVLETELQPPTLPPPRAQQTSVSETKETDTMSSLYDKPTNNGEVPQLLLLDKKKSLLLTVSSHYHNLNYIDRLLRQTVNEEGLPFFKKLTTMYEDFKRKVTMTPTVAATNNEDNENNWETLANVNLMLELMQNIYRHVPYIMHQLLLLGFYETHEKINKLL